MKQFNRLFGLFLPVLMLMSLPAGNVQAALLDVGPVVPEVLNSSNPPQHGFPLWYRDTDRVPLEICLSRATSPTVAGALMCTLLPGPGFDLALPTSFPGNFPDELFWWTGDARVRGADLVNGNQSIGFETQLIMAIEGGFPSGAAVSGDQTSFARIRILMDTVIPGTYRVIHPYGVNTFLITQAAIDDNDGGARIIFFTTDVGLSPGGNFGGALQGQIGPFLRWDTGVPIIVGGEQFIGDPSVDHTVTGSPFGTNKLRVEGPAGSGIGGLGVDFIETTLFAVSGQIHQAVIPTPLKGDRAAYARDIGGMQVNVFATTQPFSNETQPLPFPANFTLLNTPSALLLSGAILADTAMVTNSPGDGKFFTVTDRLADPGIVPATVRVSNTADAPLSFIDPALTDWVTIGSATYSKLNNSLTITASSSDSVAPPLLTAFISGTAVSLGSLVNGQLVVPLPFTDNSVTPAKTYSIPPESITVKSAAGGAVSAPVVTFILPPLAR